MILTPDGVDCFLEGIDTSSIYGYSVLRTFCIDRVNIWLLEDLFHSTCMCFGSNIWANT